jgi:pyruvate kinase
MLESMIVNRLPTRAEATDVANAILDGTDAVMLSGESAVGRYPVESVAMLAKIAKATEDYRSSFIPVHSVEATAVGESIEAEDLIAASVEAALQRITPATVIIPTHSGRTARGIARFRLPAWITALSSEHKTCQDLLFSYGVFPCFEPDHPDDWQSWSRRWLKDMGLKGRFVVLTEGPSRKNPNCNNRMEIMDLKQQGPG